MKTFFTASTEFTPKAAFNGENGLFELEGVSRPENVSGFYEPLIQWIKNFEEDCCNEVIWPVTRIRTDIKLTYCNSASSKYIYQLLEIIVSWKKYGLYPLINWYYDESDDKMKDDGQDLSDALEYPFVYIPVND
jgi:hypothetical protein